MDSKPNYPLNIKGHKSRVSTLVISPDNQYLISASLKEIIIWNRVKNIIQDYVLVHNNPVEFITTPNSQYFISVSSDLACKWNIQESCIESLKKIKSFGPKCIDSSQNYNLVALCSSDLIKLLSLSNLKQISSAYSTSFITSVLFSTQSTLIIGSDEGEVQIYSLDLQILKTLKLTSKILKLDLNQNLVACSLHSISSFATIDLSGYDIKLYTLPLKCESSKVVILNDLTKVVYANKNFELVVFSLEAGEVIKSVLKNKAMISDFVLNNDESLAFVTGFDKKIRWAGIFSNIKQKFNAHFSDINCTLIQGNKLYSCGKDKTLRVWSLESGNQESLIKIHDSYVSQMKLLKGSNIIICYSGCLTNNIIILDTDRKSKTLMSANYLNSTRSESITRSNKFVILVFNESAFIIKLC